MRIASWFLFGQIHSLRSGCNRNRRHDTAAIFYGLISRIIRCCRQPSTPQSLLAKHINDALAQELKGQLILGQTRCGKSHVSNIVTGSPSSQSGFFQQVLESLRAKDFCGSQNSENRHDRETELLRIARTRNVEGRP